MDSALVGTDIMTTLQIAKAQCQISENIQCHSTMCTLSYLHTSMAHNTQHNWKCNSIILNDPSLTKCKTGLTLKPF